MKRYLLFIFSRFYPSGGWNDLFNSYDTIEEAKKTFEQECDITPQTEYYGEGCQIVDSTNFKIVAQFNHSAFNPELQGWVEKDERGSMSQEPTNKTPEHFPSAGQIILMNWRSLSPETFTREDGSIGERVASHPVKERVKVVGVEKIGTYTEIKVNFLDHPTLDGHEPLVFICSIRNHFPSWEVID